jgi:hypothetical protein
MQRASCAGSREGAKYTIRYVIILAAISGERSHVLCGLSAKRMPNRAGLSRSLQLVHLLVEIWLTIQSFIADSEVTFVSIVRDTSRSWPAETNWPHSGGVPGRGTSGPGWLSLLGVRRRARRPSGLQAGTQNQILALLAPRTPMAAGSRVWTPGSNCPRWARSGCER